MSGVVGVLNRDGAPVDREMLSRMTGFLAFRGPDAQETWIDGPVGFGHAMLRTTWEAERERQPCSLDGQVWITADARIDQREELVGSLRAAGRRPEHDATDPELILHAYHAWSERCLEELRGDFSFGIWDARVRRIFCARDHFGIKPFYYSEAGGNFLFSNTLKCLHLSPAISKRLNDSAIVDFLLHGNNQNPVTTSFQDIQRLPAGHLLTFSAEKGVQCTRYWELPMDEPTFYKRAEEYVEHFHELLRSSMRDRLRTGRVGVLMSGGLDSSALAAVARKILTEGSQQGELAAFTLVYDHLIPDEERQYAGLVADALRIPIHFLAADDYKLYERWDQPELQTPEPGHNPDAMAAVYDHYAQAAKHCRVVLYGEGPDNALHYEWRPYVRHLMSTSRWGRLARDLYCHARAHREVPLLRGLLNRRRRPREINSERLGWIRPEMLALATPGVRARPARPHPYHPVAHHLLTGPDWDWLFESRDPGFTTLPLEVRHPYMELRLIRFLLSVPSIPWGRNKYLMRRAFQDMLPKSIVERPKTSQLADPLAAKIKLSGLPIWVPHPLLYRYVDPQKIVMGAGMSTSSTLWCQLLPISLSFWLAWTDSQMP